MGKQTFRKPTSAETMTAILNEDPPSISQLTPTAPPGLQRVVHRCLEKSSEQCFQSSSDLAFALEALSDSGFTSSTGSHAAQDGGTARSRLFIVAGTGALTVLASVAVVYFWMWPPVSPKLSNFVQLTHDGQPKNLIGTEGARLYLGIFGFSGPVEMPTSGGEPNKLPYAGNPNMSIIRLSPDGSQFLVVDGLGTPSSGPLYSVPVLGGSPRRLGEAEGYDGAWSPDGKLLAYVVGADVYIARADGSEPRKLLSRNATIFPASIVWSPDGRNLRFVSAENINAPTKYWEVGEDGTNPHRLNADLPGLGSECCGNWTADRKYFLFLSGGQIWAFPRNSGFLHPAAKPIPLTSSPMPLDGPLPSTDGKKVFVVGHTLRGQLAHYDFDQILFRSKVDGSERVRLTYPPTHPFNPRWSPDNKTIAFYEGTVGKAPKIFTMSFEGASPRPLLPDDPGEQFDSNWSPDGSKIIFGPGSANPLLPSVSSI